MQRELAAYANAGESEVSTGPLTDACMLKVTNPWTSEEHAPHSRDNILVEPTQFPPTTLTFGPPGQDLDAEPAGAEVPAQTESSAGPAGAERGGIVLNETTSAAAPLLVFAGQLGMPTLVGMLMWFLSCFQRRFCDSYKLLEIILRGAFAHVCLAGL
jgi:type IV secretory pathway TrbD component